MGPKPQYLFSKKQLLKIDLCPLPPERGEQDTDRGESCHHPGSHRFFPCSSFLCSCLSFLTDKTRKQSKTSRRQKTKVKPQPYYHSKKRVCQNHERSGQNQIYGKKWGCNAVTGKTYFSETLLITDILAFPPSLLSLIFSSVCGEGFCDTRPTLIKPDFFLSTFVSQVLVYQL